MGISDEPVPRRGLRPARSSLPSRRVAIAIVVIFGLSLVIGACGSDDADDGAGRDGATSTAEPRPHPPNDVEALAAIFDPMLEPYGLRLTRGALIDRSEGGYELSDTGDHLALYAEPIDEEAYPEERYIENFWPTTAELTPYVFDRWSALASYDICQEPPASLDPSDEPFPHTQIEIGRERAAQVDWANGDLADLLTESRQGEGTRVIIARQLYDTQAYQDADAAATGGPEVIPTD